ncbi:MAG: hypothetical protein E7056_03075 [Lentisphaerae bacterium]|nr:hypothetical protein [Lentisphaerota bacterium]
MQDRFFIRDTDNIITGPFTRQHLLEQFNSAKLSVNEVVLSDDKSTWLPPETLLSELIPENPDNVAEFTPEPPPAATDNSDAEADAGAEAPQPLENADTQAEKEPVAENICHADRTFKRLAGDTVAVLFNSQSYFYRLAVKGPSAMLTAGLLAISGSVMITLLGGVLFAGRYETGTALFFIRSFVQCIASGILLWLFNLMINEFSKSGKKQKYYQMETDFLSAMLGNMNISLLVMIFNATLFMWNRNLYQMNRIQSILLAAAVLFMAMYVLGNTFLLLRINLRKNAQLRRFTSAVLAAAEMWAIVLLSYALLHPIYRNIL